MIITYVNQCGFNRAEMTTKRVETATEEIIEKASIGATSQELGLTYKQEKVAEILGGLLETLGNKELLNDEEIKNILGLC